MDKHRRHGLVAIPVMLLLIALGLVIYAFTIKATAQAILRDVSGLRVGVSSLQQVEAVAARHKLWVQEKRCDGAKCWVALEVYNTWLYRLKLEPIARFRASVETSDGIVDHIHVELRRDTRAFPTSDSAGMTSEYLTYPTEIRRLGSEAYWFPTPVGKPYLRVSLTARADDVQRQHAYAYSLTCLVKPGRGCDLPCDYLPLAWHDWEDELNKQGWNGFGGYYTMRARCP
jgi:hypothetical protein